MKQSIHPSSLGRVGVLMGGYSSERPISLKSGTAVFEALKQSGCQVSALDITAEDENEISQLIGQAKIDVAFIALHGRLGEDGTIQAILEHLKIPYTGSGVKASQLALNKSLAQQIFQQNNLPVPKHVVLSPDDKSSAEQVINQLGGLPIVVKPTCEGSSIGVTVVRTPQQFSEALAAAFQYGPEVLIERFIEGKELTVGILGDEFLPVIEIRPKNPFFDFKAKYQSGMTEYIIPAQISEKVAQQVGQTALKAHRVLGCRDFSRVDVMLNGSGNFYILEINTIPGFTSTSLLPKAAKQAGLEFAQLCLLLIQMAYEKKK